MYLDADPAELVSPLVSKARNGSGTALLGGAAMGSNENPLVEMLAAYSNPAEQVRKLRAGLAGALARDESPEEPGAATTGQRPRSMR